MKKIEQKIFIKAPKKIVWDVMFQKNTYSEWTKAFNEDSRYEGDWSEGTKMRFIGTDENKENEGGMLSVIEKNIPHEYISIKHIGIIENGVEDTTSEKAKSWAGAYENYSFVEKNGETEVLIEQDMDEKYFEEFKEMWKKALVRLKNLVEERK